MKEYGALIVSVASAIVGLAIISVVLSKRANTVEVIKAAGGVFTDAIKEAVSPITG